MATQYEKQLVSQQGPGMADYIGQQATIGAVDKSASTLRGVNVDKQDVARTQAGYAASPFVNTYKDPLLSTVNPMGVYAATNIRNIDIPSPQRAMDMKLGSLESKLAKAQSIQELNQIGIMNQPKAIGVLTGEAAYRDKLDTARVNAFNTLYQARLAEEARKEAKRQEFISLYGADPTRRPSGMSKREFAKALQAGQFANMLTQDFKLKQSQLAAAQKSNKESNVQARVMQLKAEGKSWGDAAAIIEKEYGMLPGDANSQIMDWVYGGKMPPAEAIKIVDKETKEMNPNYVEGASGPAGMKYHRWQTYSNNTRKNLDTGEVQYWDPNASGNQSTDTVPAPEVKEQPVAAPKNEGLLIRWWNRVMNQ